ncbi:ChbG/HpnK family deacetylase [Candidatus Xianfuyuplasma coldseepsis]|uniref:ChbG/HpnK family deacetylase n=1 Tax=Candidatus Xianfuyuplasma coldseepsis TaxID=2782163 RepID=A0A7L7KRV4_9MOLU|nr:ChbG/HpnK family deacetylase [Xianfuyuplasma coldseepsis]QMS85149.1 ChbG/HpnK family deacetylase [Xianfuyuplasma coldseepsis]
MKYLLLRADDLGYSPGINQGIAESVKCGLVKNVGLMVNVPSSKDGYELIKNEDVCLGLHVNITVGTPLTDPSLIPSLVDQNGLFICSKAYRTRAFDTSKRKEMALEVQAQYEEFIAITGRKPNYIESHAVYPKNLVYVMKELSKKYDILFSPFPIHDTTIRIKNHDVVVSMNPMRDGYNPKQELLNFINSSQEDYGLFVVHPGYVDGVVLHNSSLTVPRDLEREMLCDKRVIQDVQNAVQLISYTDL